MNRIIPFSFILVSVLLCSHGCNRRLSYSIDMPENVTRLHEDRACLYDRGVLICPTLLIDRDLIYWFVGVTIHNTTDTPIFYVPTGVNFALSPVSTTVTATEVNRRTPDTGEIFVIEPGDDLKLGISGERDAGGNQQVDSALLTPGQVKRAGDSAYVPLDSIHFRLWFGRSP